jgi:hypothetical protein
MLRAHSLLSSGPFFLIIRFSISHQSSSCLVSHKTDVNVDSRPETHRSLIFSFSLTAGIFVEHRNNHSNHSVEFEMRATHKMFLLDAFASYLGY